MAGGLTAVGSHNAAFGLVEWALLVGVALIWGTSFLWIKLALEGFPPGLVAWLRLTLGNATVGCCLLALHGGVGGAARAVRAVWVPADRRRVVCLGLLWMALPLTTLAFTGQLIDSSLRYEYTLPHALRMHRTPCAHTNALTCTLI